MKKLLTAIILIILVCAFTGGCHQHTFSQDWEYNSEYHWHPSTCEHAVVDGQALHTLHEGECSVCGYSSHTHTYKTTYSYDDTYHWYASTCGHNVQKSKNYHNFSGDICQDCNYEYHQHTYQTQWSYDDEYHWYASTCEHAFATKDKSAHTVENGVCTACGKEIDGITFTLRTDGNYALKRYVGNDKEYEIPATYNSKAVVEIYPDAFAGCEVLEKITVPNSILYIGKGAFWGCSSLKEITLPFVGATAFETRWSQTTLLGYIFGSDLYQGGVSVKQFTISKEIEYYMPKTLEKITVTGGKVYCGAFRNCATLTTVILPENATTIEDETFVGCSSLTNFTIPQNVNYIGRESFVDCVSLATITIPSKVTRIRERAFEGCILLTQIDLPASVGEIGRLAFDGCLSLSKINADSENTTFVSVNGVLYNKAKTSIAVMPCAYFGELQLPATLVSLDTAIFEDNFGITDISISNDNTVFSSQGGILYNKDKTEIILVPKAKVGEVTIAQGVTSIPNEAFYGCNKITKVYFPSTLTTIGLQAFEDCVNLSSVALPPSLKGISIGAFSGCKNLNYIVIPATVTYIGEYAFNGCITVRVFLESIQNISSWDDYWADGIGSGVYGPENWHYENGVPTPIQ